LEENKEKMKNNILFLIKLYGSLVILFLLEKPLFILFNNTDQTLRIKDYYEVMSHGLSLDLAVAAYITAIPALLVFISLIYSFQFKKLIRPYYYLIALLVAILFIVDTSLYSFWHFKLDATIFLYLDSPADAMASVSTLYLLIRTILIILFTAGIIYMFIAVTPVKIKETSFFMRNKIGIKIANILMMLLVFLGLFWAIRGGFKESTTNVGQVYYSENQFLNHSAVNPIFSLLSSISKSKAYEKQFNFFDEKKKERLFKTLYKPLHGTTPEILKTKRPNLLIILFESFGAGFVEAVGGEHDVTPNYNRLAKEGILFTQCYANSFRTDRGLVAALSGHLGYPTASIMKMPIKSKTLPSIASSLVKEGYKTDFLYGGDINFTNTKGYLLSTGYQHLTSDKDFPSYQKTTKWGAHDEYTFQHLYEMLTQRKQQPWMTSYLTLSSHEPFDVPYHRLKEKIPNAVAYTDYCFGQFIEKLKKSPLWDNLLIVCVSDHGFYYPRTAPSTRPDYFHIPILWLGGAIKAPMKINKIINQTDLSATLLQQLGITHDSFMYSRDVLNSDYTYPFAYYAYNNGMTFIDSTGVTTYDNNANKIIYNTSVNKDRLDKAKAILQMSYDDLGAR
jgi:phosphoglycerol transferase MdoB-like AlkP superfamily enzyme